MLAEELKKSLKWTHLTFSKIINAGGSGRLQCQENNITFQTQLPKFNLFLSSSKIPFNSFEPHDFSFTFEIGNPAEDFLWRGLFTFSVPDDRAQDNTFLAIKGSLG